MAVFRVEKTKNYTVMSNEHFKEKNMSLKAKGLLSLMLSLPDDWDYSISGLCAICKENESAIKSTLDELKKFGYLKVKKLLPNETDTGRIEYEYHIYETPQKQDIEKQGVEKQGIENQPLEILQLEIQPLENQGQLNTKEVNTNKENTKEVNIKNKNYNAEVAEIVQYLNLKASTRYRASSQSTRKHICARLNEGFTVSDFKTVIDKKCTEWLKSEMAKYLRPETLFGTKFEGYLNAKISDKKWISGRDSQTSNPFLREKERRMHSLRITGTEREYDIDELETLLVVDIDDLDYDDEEYGADYE